MLDAGHQLGNHNFPAEINRLVPAGGFSKPCNTTGTATDGGYAEATFAWNVTMKLKAKLEKSGATVVLTRTSNREDRWGPCIDVRGRAGNTLRSSAEADLKLSIHGDGSLAGDAHGFHVIYPPDRAPWTDDIHKPSKRLASVTKDALVEQGSRWPTTSPAATAWTSAADLGTLNLSDVPVVMLELGNMRDSGDAAVMTSAQGQTRYARALAVAVTRVPRLSTRLSNEFPTVWSFRLSIPGPALTIGVLRGSVRATGERDTAAPNRRAW